MLTIKELSSFVSSDRKKRAVTEVTVAKVKKGTNKKGNPVIQAETSTRYDSQGNKKRFIVKHKTNIQLLLDKGATKSKPYIKVSCDCEFHMYNCEYALYKKGAADIIYSNGEKPTVKNVGLKPLMCIHVIALLEHIQK